jgi:5-hydroxyisourate hydrolase-like protein (transthyretin family)
MRRALTVFLMALWPSVVCIAQTPPPLPPGFQPSPRDTSAQTGTAILRGHIYDASNGAPLRKVQVRVTSPELRENRVAITDDRGAYEIRNLPASRYQLTASKGSYVALQYGQTRPFEQGKPLEVRDAQVLEKVDLSLPRGAVITGRVVDEAGEPTADVNVQVMRYQYANGRRQLAPVRAAQTNDIGEYRLFALPPGQYVISATFRGGLNFINDAAPDNRLGYAPTYYPGTANVTDAQRITVGLAQTISDINIALSPTRLARISGVAVDSNGKPVSQGLLLLTQTGGTMFLQNVGGQTQPDGSFTIPNVAPGDYAVRVLSSSAAGGNANELIQGEVSVAGDDINSLRLIGIKPSTVTGRVIPPPGRDASTLRDLQLLFIPRAPVPLGGNSGGRVNEDGTFELKVSPGNSLLRLNPTGGFAAMRITTVRLNGVDVTDTGVDIRPNQDLGGLEVALTTQLASVIGMVTDARGNAVKDYTVLIFARDRERWEPTSRYLYSARPDQDGRYKAQYVLPGAYYAVALDYVEQGANSDPELLERVKDRAIELSIADTETKSLDLKLVTGL